MSWTTPNVSDYLLFIRNVMGVSTTQLPDDSPYIQYSFDNALEVVNQDLAIMSSRMYTLAVYNLGGDYLINYAPDQPGQTYFADLRKAFKINAFVAGVISSASDEGTSESLTVPEAFQHLTLADLQNLKTPYGRQYLAIAQRYGTIWGLS